MMNFNYDLQQAVQSQLDAGEQLLWYGQPIARRTIRSAMPIVLFGIMWTAFALFWMAGAAGFRFPDFSRLSESLFALFGLPFVLIGLGLLASPYFVYKKAKRTVYAITNRRAIVIVSGKFKFIQSYSGKDIGTISRSERADGTGDIFFGEEAGEKRTKPVGFLAIPDVRRVERILIDTFKKDGRASHQSWPDTTGARSSAGF
jgi:hypothetical protein